ncbi:hypothetical protein [Hymenobacter koreensis]|uniref:DUF3592 domain-containing protein n=1 Tax=Hymenobacter koreensis TaxID=1084523 RepID=A0ABP8ITJ4_9BACT
MSSKESGAEVYALVAAAGFFVVSCFQWFISYQVSNGPEAMATVLSKEFHNSGRNRQYQLGLAYPTPISDSTYSTMSVTAEQFNNAFEGQRISILYNRTSVSQTQFADKPWSGHWQLLISTSLLGLMIYRVRH